jgi:hypothetical protein
MPHSGGDARDPGLWRLLHDGKSKVAPDTVGIHAPDETLKALREAAFLWLKHGRRETSPLADFLTGAAWLMLAIAIMIGAWQMDRLERLSAAIYTAPGLVPGLLGVAIALMSVILMVRGARAGALADVRLPPLRIADHWRLIASLLLGLGFAIGLVGHGPPFRIAAAIYIAIAVFVFQFPDRRRDKTLARGAMFAVVFGLIFGFAIHYLFQDLFLVRLP